MIQHTTGDKMEMEMEMKMEMEMEMEIDCVAIDHLSG